MQCAIEAQTALAGANTGVPPDKCINFRIGIHIGDVMVRSGDLFGDGVNIAARLQTLATPGTVCISGATYDQVRKVLPLAFVDLGVQQVKNIQEPIRVYQVSAPSETQQAARVRVAGAESPPPLPDKPSIAVLPFQNMSGDPEQEYFSDGMVEDIITALSRFKSLFVISRNSSFTYKGMVVDIKQVGRELGVRYVLEGSVRKAGNKVRITGQLIDATTGAHLWADRFDGPLDDIFELQDKVTSSVVAAIAPRLEQAEIDRSECEPTESLDAVDLYYRAVHSYRSYTREGNEAALRLIRQAISLDPNFAAAYGVALACFSQRFDESWMEHVDEEITEAKQYALRAVELGADDAFALSRAAHFFGQQLKDAETADTIVDQAIIVNPNLSEAWRIRGHISIYLGRHEAAAQQFQHAMRLNPLDPEIYKAQTGLAMANFLLRQFEIALSWATKSLAHQKKYAIPVLFAVASSAMLGRIADAKALLAHSNASGNPLTISRFKKRTPLKRQEDVDLLTEAYRLAGMPE